jgi:hypothetical protein
MNEEDLNQISGMIDTIINNIHVYYDRGVIDKEYIDALEHAFKELMGKYNAIYKLVEDEKK